MRKICVCGLLTAIGMIAAASDAFAAVVMFDCTSTPGALATEFNTTHPGGLAGTTYEINGTCMGSFTIFNNNITIETVFAAMATATIDGQVSIANAGGITLGQPAANNLMINGGGNTDSVDISNAGNVILRNLTINGPTTGTTGPIVMITSPASVTISGSTIQEDGTHGANGVACVGPAYVTIANSTIQGLGGTNGFFGPGAGVIGTGSCFLRLNGPLTIQNNAGDGLVVSSGATALASGGINITVPNTSPGQSAIVATEQSHVTLSFGVTVIGPSAGTNHTIVALQGSSVLLQNVNLTADTLPANPQFPFAVITAAGSSSIVLAGGNTIDNIAAGGVAILVADGSSFIQSNGALFGFTPGTDTVTGNGRFQTQSSAEMGISPGGGGLTWTGTIKAAQASSVRMDGDNVTINGTLELAQGASLYDNFSAGTSNSITHLLCDSTTDHVSNLADVSTVTNNCTLFP